MRWPKNGATKGLVVLAGLAVIPTLNAHSTSLSKILLLPAWYGYGGDSQHTNDSKFTSLPLGTVKWSIPVDYDNNNSGASHYASPGITRLNTLVVPVTVTAGQQYQVEGHRGLDGALQWTLPSDYIMSSTAYTYWYSVYPMTLTGISTVVAAGGGGTILVKSDADNANSPTTRYCFYQPVSNYTQNPSAYSSVKINTAMVGDQAGNAYFGYDCEGSQPTGLAGTLAWGGIAKFNIGGSTTFRRGNDMVPSSPSDVVRPMYNVAPVETNDRSAIYAAMDNLSTGHHYLVKLNANTLAPITYVQLVDPVNGYDISICPCGSGSPMVAPDGKVFFGVLRNNDYTSHGWMLQFDANLNQFTPRGVRYPVGAFGWDDTPSVVPSYAVPSYKGKSEYLILTKYNNYKGTGGNGRNRLAVLDPLNDNVTVDWISGIHTMNEVLTIPGVTCDSDFYDCTDTTNVNDPNVPVREWCINAAAVDAPSHSALVNSEDGHAYRWSFDTNTLTQATYLQPATGEPYTPTVVGPDGTVYAINNGRMHAMSPTHRVLPTLPTAPR
jgi:hypothetical protein